MKLNAWQMIALAAVLLAAIIVANVFAPGAVAMVTSIAGALVALFVEKAKDTKPTDEQPAPPAAPKDGAS